MTQDGMEIVGERFPRRGAINCAPTISNIIPFPFVSFVHSVAINSVSFYDFEPKKYGHKKAQRAQCKKVEN